MWQTQRGKEHYYFNLKSQKQQISRLEVQDAAAMHESLTWLNNRSHPVFLSFLFFFVLFVCLERERVVCVSVCVCV